METIDKQFTGVISKLQRLKKLAKQYQEKWANYPFSGDINHSGDDFWQKKTHLLVNDIDLKRDELWELIKEHTSPEDNFVGEYVMPTGTFTVNLSRDIKYVINSREPDKVDALIQLLKKVQRRHHAKAEASGNAGGKDETTPKTEQGSKSTLVSEENKTAKSNVSGMSWKKAQKKAEALVDEKGYLGHKKLHEAIGCSDNTLRKAIKKSSKLQQAKEQYESTSKTLKAVGFTAKVVATYEGSSGSKLSDTEADEILVEMLVRIKRERPEMFEQTKKQLDEMNPDGKRKFAAIYQRDYQNKDKSLSKDGPKTLRRYKQV